MPNIHGLADRPTLFQRERTTIVDGIITRDKVWVDSRGKEYRQGKELPKIDQTETDPDTLVFVCVVSLFCVIFFLGFWLGAMMRIRRKKVENSKEKTSANLLQSQTQNQVQG